MNPHWNGCTAYEEAYKRSLESPEEFWGEIGLYVDWSKPWHKVLDNSNEPFTKWYVKHRRLADVYTQTRDFRAEYGEMRHVHSGRMSRSPQLPLR